MTDELTYEQGRSALDRKTQQVLGISVDEFLNRLDAGKYRGCEDMDVVGLAMLVPFARPGGPDGNDGLTDDERRALAMRYGARAGRRSIGASALVAHKRIREEKRDV